MRIPVNDWEALWRYQESDRYSWRFDDKFCFAKQTWQNFDVSERAKDHNIKFNLKKIQLRVPEVKYFGNIVSKERLKPDPEKINAIFEIPQTENKQDT